QFVVGEIPEFGISEFCATARLAAPSTSIGRQIDCASPLAWCWRARACMPRPVRTVEGKARRRSGQARMWWKFRHVRVEPAESCPQGGATGARFGAEKREGGFGVLNL